MSRISLSTSERIEADVAGIRRTTLVVLTLDGIRYTTEARDQRHAARLILLASRALGIGRGDVDASEDVP